MPETPQRTLEPMSRSDVNIFYFFEAAILAYFIFRSLQGNLGLPSRHGTLFLHGWAAWLGCLSHLGLIGLTYFRFDPSSVRFTDNVRRCCGIVCVIFFVAVLGVASLLGSSV